MEVNICNGATIYVDVDGTLRTDGKWNMPLIRWLHRKRKEGAVLVLWSAQGSAYASQAGAAPVVAGLFTACVGKPSLMIDDRGVSWLDATMVLPPSAIR